MEIVINKINSNHSLIANLAGVEASVVEAEGGDDVSEGGCDVAPAPRPPYRGDTRVGVNLNKC